MYCSFHEAQCSLLDLWGAYGEMRFPSPNIKIALYEGHCKKCHENGPKKAYCGDIPYNVLNRRISLFLD